ncbi:MAG: hypothetical protein K8I82_31555 [Anaerolineae bacterium]|nr:hypothetical protein [Anaerolineae bacterium]
MTKVDLLREVIQQIADNDPEFFTTKGHGPGNHATNIFIRKVHDTALEVFGQDCAEQKICGDNSQAVDFYFEDEKTIVEIALGLKKTNTEFEKDIFKALSS